MSAYSQWRSGKSQEQAANANADVAGYQARDAEQQGAYDARKIQIEGRRLGASALTTYGASGVVSSTGSPADIIESSNANAGIDAARARANAARTAWGFKNEAEIQRKQGRDAMTAGYLGALGSGLSGVGSAAGAYAGMKK